MTDIDCKVIENLFASDLDYLQRLYERINGGEEENAPSAAAFPQAEERAATVREFRAVGEA
jgi:hypothetical protein